MDTFNNWVKLKEAGHFDDVGRWVDDSPYGHDYDPREIKKFGHNKAHPSLINNLGGTYHPNEGDEFVLQNPDGTTEHGIVTHSSGVGGLGGKLRIKLDDGQIFEMDFNKEYKRGHISLSNPPRSVNQPSVKKTFIVKFS
jgi:hypothetical protein